MGAMRQIPCCSEANSHSTSLLSFAGEDLANHSESQGRLNYNDGQTFRCMPIP